MKRIAYLALGASLILTALATVPESVASSATSATSAKVPWVHADNNPHGCTTSCTSAPPGGPGSSIAYDGASRQLVLFGALGSNSTWVWNGTSWKQVDDGSDPGCTSSCAASPPARNTFGMAYDPAAKVIVIFGGNALNDTWIWNGTGWAHVDNAGDTGCTDSCTDSPPSSLGDLMTYDAATSQLVLFGGSADYSTPNSNDTWILSFHGPSTYSWSQVDDTVIPGCNSDCTSSPPGRNVADMAYDPATEQLVVFGGEQTSDEANGLNDTWTWNGSKWRQVDDDNGYDSGCGESMPTLDPCPTSPPGRVGSVMAYDPALGQLVVFGGMIDYNSTEYNDTWAWNGTTWTHLDYGSNPSCTSVCAASPPTRDTFAMADDAATNQLVMFGGYSDFGGSFYYNDTWIASAVPAVPSAPTHVSAVTDISKVIISWHAPTFTGPTPINEYQVTASPGKKSCTTSRTKQCTISGLNTKQRYTISVTATNSVGTGRAAVLKKVKG